jgi:hypothetical protein
MAETEIQQSWWSKAYDKIHGNVSAMFVAWAFFISTCCFVGLVAATEVTTPATSLDEFSDFEVLIYTITATGVSIISLLMTIVYLLWSGDS